MMSLYEKILKKQDYIAVVGLGYVGINIAVEFSKYANVIGYDINKEKINAYSNGIDITAEMGDKSIKECSVQWTCNSAKLATAKFIIISVPTPVDKENKPDLSYIINASEIVGSHLTKDAIVVYESTVYPGVTEDVCIPILEKESGMKCGDDFKVGYSPERINPGDKIHRLTSIKKIVSGMDAESLEEIANIYQIVVAAGVYKASCIKVAEAAKLVENSQRDINIAFMNELSMIFNNMGIDTLEVLEAAETKWNFMPFRPGLVGGHCIGIDPYYLSYCADKNECNHRVVSSSREVNSEMGKYIAQQTIKQILKAGIFPQKAKIGCLGITFKENCNDIRNTKVVNIINELKEYGATTIVCDTVANSEEVKTQYGIELSKMGDFFDLDCLIIAVPHDDFNSITDLELMKMFKDNSPQRILIDIKHSRNKSFWKGDLYWSL